MQNIETKTTDTVLEELKRITDPQTVGQAVKEIKAHIDARFDALEQRIDKREKRFLQGLYEIIKNAVGVLERLLK